MKSMKKGKPNPFAKIKPLPALKGKPALSTKKKSPAGAGGPIGAKDLSSMKESLK